MISLLLAPLLATQVVAGDGIIASGPNGPTNPEKPEFMAVGSKINPESDARLISLNSVDDFCMYAPMEPGSTIGDVEHNVVAWCTKPRNNARLIPDGAIKSAQFIKTEAYVQISGYWDSTALNIQPGDDGGELDPHGATGEGNPVGGNVTSNAVDGKDVFYEEWMSFVSDDQFCLRVCTKNYKGYPAALMCEHELDIMGCNFVMAIPYDADREGFTECEGEPAAPPGLYPDPEDEKKVSTFRQRFTGSWLGAIHTIGNTVTPSAPAFFPKSSNCKTYKTIANGVDTKNWEVKEKPTLLRDGGAEATPLPGSNSTQATDAPKTDASKTDVPKTEATKTDTAQTGDAPSATGTEPNGQGEVSKTMTALPDNTAAPDGKADASKTEEAAPGATTSSSDRETRQFSIMVAFAALAGGLVSLI